MKTANLLKIAALVLLATGIKPQIVVGSSLVLSPQRVTAVLNGSRVEISTSDGIPPTLRVVRRDGSDVPIESTGITVGNNVVTIRSAEPQENQADLVFFFNLEPSQDFQIDGIDLDLRINGQEESEIEVDYDEHDEPADGDGTGIVCPSSRILNLTDGTASVVAGGCLEITSVQTDVTIERTYQSLHLNATGGTISIRDHHGAIVFKGESEAVGRFVGHRGALDAEISQSRLSTVRGNGAIKCQTSEHSVVDVRGHQGTIDIKGSLSSIEVQQGSAGGVRLTGNDFQSRLSEGQGPVKATVEGGSLAVEDWAGRIDLQSAPGTTIDIDSVDGDFALLVDGTEGDVKGILGHTRGNLLNSSIDFSELKSLEITADSSEISVEAVSQITQMALSGGHLEFEGFGVIGKPKISLSAEASARILIPQPCIIRCSGPGAQDMGHVVISGCEFRAPNQPWGRRPQQAEPAILLEVEMQQQTEVFVSGY